MVCSHLKEKGLKVAFGLLLLLLLLLLLFFWGGGRGEGGWGGNKLGLKRYTHKPVSPLVGSEAPCCGAGLSGIFLLNIHITF